MPVVHDGGSAPPPLVPRDVVVADPVVSGGTTVVQQSGTVEQAVSEASRAVKVIRVGAPSRESLPSNAEVGQLYTFASAPDVLYYYGPDNVWRAVTSVRVT